MNTLKLFIHIMQLSMLNLIEKTEKKNSPRQTIEHLTSGGSQIVGMRRRVSAKAARRPAGLQGN
jgi:hypothetical protein